MTLRTNEAGKLSASPKESHSKSVFHKQLARKCLSKSTVRTALGKVDHCLELIFLAVWGAQMKYFFLFLLLLMECKTYRKSAGEVLIADLGIAGN